MTASSDPTKGRDGCIAATTRLQAITHKLISGPKLSGGDRPYFLWFGWRQWLHFNVHSNETCRLCWTIGPVGFRWFR